MKIDRDVLVKWLLREGFIKERAEGGHARFCLPSGGTVTVVMHGKKEDGAAQTRGAITLRQLERLGYDRKRLRDELS